MPMFVSNFICIYQSSFLIAVFETNLAMHKQHNGPSRFGGKNMQQASSAALVWGKNTGVKRRKKSKWLLMQENLNNDFKRGKTCKCPLRRKISNLL